MSGLLRVIPNLVATSQKIAVQFLKKSSGYHTITSASLPAVNPGGLFSLSVRNVIRIHFPRPSETKRVKRHGWNKRMSTPAGRRVLMNRILKGRWVYSH